MRHHHFGEGSYDAVGKIDAELLTEAGATGIGQELVSVDPRGLEAAADWESLRSPETYLGQERTEALPLRRGYLGYRACLDAAPAQLRLNHWALAAIGR